MAQSPSYDDFMGSDAVEVGGSGDFAPTHDFEENPVLVGTYTGSRLVNTRNGERTIHSFITPDGSPRDAWGAAIINSRLKSVPEGARVKITSTGKMVKSERTGRSSREFIVLVAKASLKQA